MNLEQRIEAANERYAHIMWWQGSEDAFVIAGHSVEDPTLLTEFTPEGLDAIGKLMVRGYYGQLESMERESDEVSPVYSPKPAALMITSRRVTAAIPKSMIEWFSSDLNHAKEWMRDSVVAMKGVRAKLFAEQTRGEAYDPGSGASFHRVEQGAGDRKLIIPHLVLNPAGCSCIGSDPGDRDWLLIEEMGYIDLKQHNVDSYADTIPIAAGLATLNAVLIDKA